MITIIDYGVGNLNSIKNMFKKIGYRDVIISSTPKDIQSANKYILPGVGHFDYGMKSLLNSGMLEILESEVINKRKPILGICLGAQLLTKGSEEGKTPGLGWVDAETVSFNKSEFNQELKIPHMGWTDVNSNKKTKLYESMHLNPRFYFVHSYHMKCSNPDDIAFTSNYGYDFVSGFESDNILGVQFHPEKSHKFGMKLLENYVKFY